VDTIWNGHHDAAICVGNLFDVYHHKGHLSWRLFKTVLFRFMHNVIIKILFVETNSDISSFTSCNYVDIACMT